MRVGLALGAGGVVGGAWLIGALEALADETGWNPASAERIIGTSAGAVVGAMIADGLEPQYLAAYAGGGSLSGIEDTEGRAGDLARRVATEGGSDLVDDVATRLSGDELRLQLATPPIGPGSWRMALSTLTKPHRHAPAAVMAGWLPRGFISTKPIAELVETFVKGQWPAHPSFQAVAADYRDGHRVAFGGDDAPPAAIGDAVAASCAIPGFYHPVTIAGRRYIDGGVCSMSNLDLLSGHGLDLVVCLNPTSSLAAVAGGTPAERLGGLMRAASGRRLGREARKLREEGTELLLLQPGVEDVRAMGLNLMARGKRVAVLERARRTTALALREMRDSGVTMPARARRKVAAIKPGRAPAARSAPARAGGPRRSAGRTGAAAPVRQAAQRDGRRRAAS